MPMANVDDDDDDDDDLDDAVGREVALARLVGFTPPELATVRRAATGELPVERFAAYPSFDPSVDVPPDMSLFAAAISDTSRHADPVVAPSAAECPPTLHLGTRS